MKPLVLVFAEFFSFLDWPYFIPVFVVPYVLGWYRLGEIVIGLVFRSKGGA